MNYDPKQNIFPMQLATELGARRRRTKQQLDEIRLNSTVTAIKTARKMLKNDVASRNVTQVARDIGLSRGCIKNIVEDVTKEPRFSTMLMIYNHYGFRVLLSGA